jgi:hypothetical protein
MNRGFGDRNGELLTVTIVGPAARSLNIFDGAHFRRILFRSSTDMPHGCQTESFCKPGLGNGGRQPARDFAVSER